LARLTLDALRAFPDDARQASGFQLRRVQQGLRPTDWKPMPVVGPGVVEIRVHTQAEHRVIYLARFTEAVYVLHAFEKRTQKTPKAEIDTAKRRLTELIRMRRHT
jgi:phage-related protein